MFMKDFTRFAEDIAAVPPLESLTSAAVLTGLVAGTRVETDCGWRDVTALSRGDRVQTLDGGLARILGLDRREAEIETLLLPGGYMDACSDLCLLPRQPILVSTLDDPEIGAAPFVLIPAEALGSLPFLSRVKQKAEVITPLFADEEVVFANSGVLLRCPGVIEGAGPMSMDSFFPTLDLEEARAFLSRREARLWA
ncbi:Hint domain-containing protein [Stagnihabitans tardus]|uniref:Hedgehog/Intein (Hint) domain-containing protein n=1 Tax=Stagnihabitans tardus TaxID=2699202 RepID=A0AAE4YBY1_9RHOB|nr:Hint domain-containing protein [Stagnihabitans tardus]NBZ88418.1 hypothetical protein [Stagnihabitans tardus]